MKKFLINVAFNYATLVIGYFFYFINPQLLYYIIFPIGWIVIAMHNTIHAENPYWNLFYGVNLILAGAASCYVPCIRYDEPKAMESAIFLTAISIFVTGVLAAISFIVSLVKYYKERE